MDKENKYLGHLPDGGGIQAHSVDDLYPLVIYSKGQGNTERWGIMYGGFSYLAPKGTPLGTVMSLARFGRTLYHVGGTGKSALIGYLAGLDNAPSIERKHHGV